MTLPDCGLPSLLALVGPERFAAYCRGPYAAPEMADARRRGAAADLYGIGVLLYEALTGALPEGLVRTDGDRDTSARFGLLELDLQAAPGEAPCLESMDGLPEGLARTIQACLHPDPTERPLSTRDLRVAFGFARPPDPQAQAQVADLLRRAALDDVIEVEYSAADQSGLLRCPGCGRMVRREASRCLACGFALGPARPAARADRTRAEMLETDDSGASAPLPAPPAETTRDEPEEELRTGDARTDFFVNQGDRLLGRGRHEDAIRAYEMATKSPAPSGIAFNRLGDALLLVHRYEEAERAYERALYLNPRDYDAMHDLARVCLSRGNATRAAELLERIASEPVPPEMRLSALTHLGSALGRVGRLGEAIEVWETVVVEGPPNAPVLYSLGVAYATLGDTAAAERRWKLALDADPAHTESRIALSQCRAENRLGAEDAREEPPRGSSLLASALDALGSMLGPRRPV